MVLFLLKPKQVLIIYASVTIQAATANQAQFANEVDILLPSQAALTGDSKSFVQNFTH